MSEFLQDLLKKVKRSADDLDAPLDEPDSKNDGSSVSSRHKKNIKPGLPIKPGLVTPGGSEPGLPSESGFVGEPGLLPDAGLSGEPGLPSESGLVGEPFSVQLLRKLTDSRQAINAIIP